MLTRALTSHRTIYAHVPFCQCQDEGCCSSQGHEKAYAMTALTFIGITSCLTRENQGIQFDPNKARIARRPEQTGLRGCFFGTHGPCENFLADLRCRRRPAAALAGLCFQDYAPQEPNWKEISFQEPGNAVNQFPCQRAVLFGDRLRPRIRGSCFVDNIIRVTRNRPIDERAFE